MALDARLPRICSHCSLPVPKGEPLVEGLCRRCIDEEGPPVDDELEVRVVAEVLGSGLRAIARACADGDPRITDPTKCETCRAIHATRRKRDYAPTKAPHPARFLHQDGEDLRRYYSKTQSAGIGARKGTMLDAMAERTGEPAKWKSKEKPQRTEPRCPVCAAKARAEALAEERARHPLMVLDSESGATRQATAEEEANFLAAAERDGVAVMYPFRWKTGDVESVAREAVAEDLVADPDAAHFKTAEEMMTAAMLGEDAEPAPASTAVDVHAVARELALATSAAAHDVLMGSMLHGSAEVRIGADGAMAVAAPAPSLGRSLGRSLAEWAIFRQQAANLNLHYEALLGDLGMGDELREAAAPLNGSHRHSKADHEHFKPVRFYDKEVTVDGKTRLVQVAVYPPSLEPIAFDSQRIQAKGSGSCGAFGSWDEQALAFVAGRQTDHLVARILARIAEHHRDVLEGYYATTEELTVRQGIDAQLGSFVEVAQHTSAAAKALEDLREGGSVGLEDPQAAVNLLRKRAAGSGQHREASVKRLQTMRQQAEALLIEAQTAYGLAASRVG